jgi:hypothetical protein
MSGVKTFEGESRAFDYADVPGDTSECYYVKLVRVIKTVDCR